MSQQDLWAVLGRAKVDNGFADQLFQDFDGALKSNGYSLTADEVKTARGGISGATGGGTGGGTGDAGQGAQPGGAAPYDHSLWKAQQAETKRRMVAQSDRMISLGTFTVNTLQETIQHATGTYKKITMMNEVMFWMGCLLFLFAVGYGVYTHNLVYSAAFAGLGVVSFVGVFFLGPISKTQAALSNLISAEIAFMSYFEQLWLIEGYATLPNDARGTPDPLRVEKASEMMERRSSQTAELLHRYLDKDKELKAKEADSDVAAAKAVVDGK